MIGCSKLGTRLDQKGRVRSAKERFAGIPKVRSGQMEKDLSGRLLRDVAIQSSRRKELPPWNLESHLMQYELAKIILPFVIASGYDLT